jgi:hypothetical protein
LIDKVAEKRHLLERAEESGSLNHEAKLRAEIEKFQQGFREKKPSVIEISTSAGRIFDADMANLRALHEECKDPEMRRLLSIIGRSLEYLNRQKGNE